jgi:hypothetical protein
MVKLAVLGLLLVSMIGLVTLGLFTTGFGTSYLAEDLIPGPGHGGCYRDNGFSQREGNSDFVCPGSGLGEGDFECEGPNNEECEEYCQDNGTASEDCPRMNSGCPGGACQY